MNVCRCRRGVACHLTRPTPELPAIPAQASPLRDLVVLPEEPVSLPPRVHVQEYRIEHARSTVDLVERRSNVRRVQLRTRPQPAGRVVRDPSRVDSVHEHALPGVVPGAGAREHVERGLGHVGVRVPAVLLPHRELPLQRRHVDDVPPHPSLALLRARRQQRQQPAAEHKGRDRVGSHRVQHLARRHAAQPPAPRVVEGQVQGLPRLVEHRQPCARALREPRQLLRRHPCHRRPR
eukprot:274978-Rhodomonas_salina.1